MLFRLNPHPDFFKGDVLFQNFLCFLRLFLVQTYSKLQNCYSFFKNSKSEIAKKNKLEFVLKYHFVMKILKIY